MGAPQLCDIILCIMKAIIYTTSWCTYCKQAVEYLKSRDIEIIEKDIEANESAKDELLEKVGFFSGVPVIDINGKILDGFNPSQIDIALKA